MLKIQFPSKEEFRSAMRSAYNEEELTDRELWILSEFGGDLE
ncbi:MAG TPA: hypothetical protein VJH23_02360 [archaeon]|nr:hypothetical protein [archaeon]